MEFKDLNILDFGNSLGQAGILFSGQGRQYVLLHADAIEGVDYGPAFQLVKMSLKDWDDLNQQMDHQMAEIVEQDNGALKKITVRKGQRAMDTTVTWKVFERDDFRCRYCARRCPLTVDHVDLWELGGPSVEENLLSACRKCNKERGSMRYDLWLTSPYYRRVSQNLTPETIWKNEVMATRLPHLATLRHTRYQGSRGS